MVLDDVALTAHGNVFQDLTELAACLERSTVFSIAAPLLGYADID